MRTQSGAPIVRTKYGGVHSAKSDTFVNFLNVSVGDSLSRKIAITASTVRLTRSERETLARLLSWLRTHPYADPYAIVLSYAARCIAPHEPAFYYRLYRLARKLESAGLACLYKTNGLLSLALEVDLIISLCASKTRAKIPGKFEDGLRLRVPRFGERVRHLLFKCPAGYTQEEWEELNASFLEWLHDSLDRCVLLRRKRSLEAVWHNIRGEERRAVLEERFEYRVVPYRTRFTSSSYARLSLAKYDHAWRRAREYGTAVYVTLTIPPIFPLWVQRYLMSALVNNLKAFIRRRYGYAPHIRINEFQPKRTGCLHVHLVIFGINRIMDKRELTRRLDSWICSFLEAMGERIRGMRRGRLSRLAVEKLNAYGLKLLKRYSRYVSQHGLEGPINYLYRIKLGKGWEWASGAPPDALKPVPNADGGVRAPNDYLRKYLSKVFWACSRAVESGDFSSFDRSDGPHSLALYWLSGVRFFSVSPALRMSSSRSASRGWEFCGSFRWDELPLAS